MRIWLLLASIALACGCATVSQGPETAKSAAGGGTPSAEARPPVTLNIEEPTMLGDFVVMLAETSGGGIVAMNGLEYVPVKPAMWRSAPFDRVVQAIAEPVGVKVQETPAYFFLYLPGYEALETVSVGGRLDPAFDAVTASIGFGYRTSMYEALALLSGSLGVTLLADQLIGDSRLGALNLAESPLNVCLEVLLKSARVSPDAFEVESTPEYVFLHAKSNPPRPVILNAPELTPAQIAFLDKKVSVAIPTSPLNISAVGKLQDALGVLSRQLGVEVAVQPGLEELPVSPSVFKDVRVRTVLELMIRQWPVAEFGYKVESNRIVIQRTP